MAFIDISNKNHLDFIFIGARDGSPAKTSFSSRAISNTGPLTSILIPAFTNYDQHKRNRVLAHGYHEFPFGGFRRALSNVVGFSGEYSCFLGRWPHCSLSHCGYRNSKPWHWIHHDLKFHIHTPMINLLFPGQQYIKSITLLPSANINFSRKIYLTRSRCFLTVQLTEESRMNCKSYLI